MVLFSLDASAGAHHRHRRRTPKQSVPAVADKHVSLQYQKTANGVYLAFKTSHRVNVVDGKIPKMANLPKRVYVDLSPATLSLEEQKQPIEINANGIVRIRVGQFKESTARFVIELEDDASYVFSKLPEGRGIEIKVTKAGMLASTEPIKSPFKAPKRLPAVNEKRVLPKLAEARSLPENNTMSHWLLKRIVIDPGHGGHDSGAVGRDGLREKDVTLALAKRVRDKLLAEVPNVKVYLTRDTDKFLELAERTQMANDVDADLFISIHANASHDRHAEGVETYYLNIAHDRYAIRLAARENKVSESQISDLEFILADLAMKSNVQDSIRLGQVVQSSLVTKVNESWGDTKDLGLKHALFYVLLGARMPAILVESSFISNRKEEKRLRSFSYQEVIAAGIVKGVKRFVDDKQAMYRP